MRLPRVCTCTARHSMRIAHGERVCHIALHRSITHASKQASIAQHLHRHGAPASKFAFASVSGWGSHSRLSALQHNALATGTPALCCCEVPGGGLGLEAHRRGIIQLSPTPYPRRLRRFS